MKTKQLGQKDRQNKKLTNTRGYLYNIKQNQFSFFTVYLKSKSKQKDNLLMTDVTGTKAKDEWEGNEDGGISGN